MTATPTYPLTHQGVRDLDNPLPPRRRNAGVGRRALPAIGGAVLAGFGLGRGGVLGLLLAAGGAALVACCATARRTNR